MGGNHGDKKGSMGIIISSGNNMFGHCQANSSEDKKGKNPAQIATLDPPPSYWVQRSRAEPQLLWTSKTLSRQHHRYNSNHARVIW